MAMIPDSIFQMIENKLRSRWKMAAAARRKLTKARALANNIAAPSPDQCAGSRHSRNSRVEKAALCVVEAENQMDETMRWLEVFRIMDQIFPEKTSSEGFVASLLYWNGMSQEDVCRFTGCARVTVRRRRDRYVIRTALIAARMGLIRDEEMMTNAADPEE